MGRHRATLWLAAGVLAGCAADRPAPTTVPPGRPGGPAPAGQLAVYAIDGAAHPQARCSDGSLPLVVAQRSARAEERRWVIGLEGGPRCHRGPDCPPAGAVGTSAAPWQALWQSGEPPADPPAGILSADPAQNPDFHDWNHVWLPACTADDWMGTASAADSPARRPFAGQWVLDAAVDALRDPGLIGAPALDRATEVLVVGSDGGARGVLHHADRLAEVLAPARVRAVVDGAFGAGPAAGDPAWAEMARSWRANADPRCEADHRGARWACLDPLTLADGGYLRTDTFWVAPWPRRPDAVRSAAIDSALARFRGVFRPREAPSPLLTTDAFTGLRVDGESVATLLGRWANQRAGQTRLVQPPP